MLSEAEKRAELRRIVREAVRLYHKGQLSEADFRALVTHAMALEMKVALDETFARVNQDINNWMDRNSDRLAKVYFSGVDA